MRRDKFILQFICFTLVGMFIFIASSAYADPLDVWTSRTSNTVNQLRECTLGNNMFICVGLNGTIVTSPDGFTPWTVRRSGTENLGGVAYGNGKFVVVGYGPTVLTSPDGISWSSQTVPTTENLERVGFGNGVFIAVGDKRAILSSSDGITWTLREFKGANPEYGIVYGNGVWVAVGANSRIWRSNDSSGETWTRISPPAIPGVPGTTEFRRVAFGNNMFVAVGDTKAGGTTHGIIVTSPDGLNWTSRTVPTGTVFLRGVRYGVGSFVVTGYSGTILTSTDGVTWVRRTSGVSTDLRGVGFGIISGNGTFVTGGDGGLILQSGAFTVPGAPTIGTATAGNAQATVSFTPPASDGGSPIISYAVTSNPGSITATGASSPITVTGLTNGTAYTFTVTATNAIGTGPPSAQSNSVTPAPVTGTPGAPTGVTAVAGNAQATVSFTAPSNGGSPITSYTVTSSPGSITATGGPNPDPITVTGLTNGTAYTFTVTATNANGTGPPSAQSNSVTPATVPDAPTGVIAVAGNAQATVSFAVPSSNGGSPIISYAVTSNPGSITATGASSPITVTGLTNGTPYTFTVTATNAIGTGPPSLPSNSVTPSAVPGVDIPNETLTNYVINFEDGVIVAFSQITGPCTISKTISGTPPGPSLSGYRFIGTFYDITNSGCPTSGAIIVTIPYNESSVPVAETSLRLFHWESSTWHDVTYSVDIGNNTITGQVTSLSPFGAGYPYSSGGGYSTGANENMIALIAIFAISIGVFILRKHRWINI